MTENMFTLSKNISYALTPCDECHYVITKVTCRLARTIMKKVKSAGAVSYLLPVNAKKS